MDPAANPLSLDEARLERARVMEWLTGVQNEVPQAQARLAYLNGWIAATETHVTPEEQPVDSS